MAGNKKRNPEEDSFFEKVKDRLFHGIQNGFESRRIVHGQISQNLAVDIHIACVDLAHELGIRHSMCACGCVNTLDPQSAEVTFLGFTVAVGVLQTFFDSVLGYCPNIFTGTEITLGKFKDLFPFCS